MAVHDDEMSISNAAGIVTPSTVTVDWRVLVLVTCEVRGVRCDTGRALLGRGSRSFIFASTVLLLLPLLLFLHDLLGR